MGLRWPALRLAPIQQTSWHLILQGVFFLLPAMIAPSKCMKLELEWYNLLLATKMQFNVCALTVVENSWCLEVVTALSGFGLRLLIVVVILQFIVILFMAHSKMSMSTTIEIGRIISHFSSKG